MELSIALFNFRNGGRVAPGCYDLSGLEYVMRRLSRPPAMTVLCEAKEYGLWEGMAKYRVLEVLDKVFDVPYQGVLATFDRGDFAPMLAFDPNILALKRWGAEKRVDDLYNIAEFRVRGSSIVFRARPEHLNFRSGLLRMPQAHLIAGRGRGNVPEIVLGDMNETASGLHLPQVDWATASWELRHHKGKKLADGSWGPHTDALDLLVGEWDESRSWDGVKVHRHDGAGFHLVPELAALGGIEPLQAFALTSNAHPLLIDTILVNDAWLGTGGVIANTYRVVGLDDPNWMFDHYAVEVVLTL